MCVSRSACVHVTVCVFVCVSKLPRSDPTKQCQLTVLLRLIADYVESPCMPAPCGVDQVSCAVNPSRCCEP